MKTAHKWIKEAPERVRTKLEPHITNRNRYKNYRTFSTCLLCAFYWGETSKIDFTMSDLMEAVEYGEKES